MIRRFTAIVLVALVPFSISSGQAEARKNVLTIQPLNAVFQFYSAEYERAATKAVTWGVGGNHVRNLFDSDASYTSAEFKLRYYPQGVALQGFSVGGALGYTNLKNNSPTQTGETAGAPSLGVLLEYQWLMGQTKNFAIALGLGAKALFINEDNSDFIARYPTARISVGWAY